jgi:predicted ATPase
MSTKNPIERLSISGFKSIQRLDKLRLNPLNVLIGANGVGKSNFVSYFRMLGEMVEGRLQKWARTQGGADRIVSFGVKETSKIASHVEFGMNGYLFEIEPTVDDGFVFADERHFFVGYGGKLKSLGSGQAEAKLKAEAETKGGVADCCYNAIASWKVFHFHDTSDTASVKRLGSLHDNDYLRPDAANLAAFLYRLGNDAPDVLEQIRKTVRLAIPFFDDFVLKPHMLKTEEEQIRLLWRQVDSDYALWPSQLSD